MAACGTFNHIFEKPTLFDSLSSWKRIQSLKSFEESYFTEILSEINRKENPESASSTSSASSYTDSTDSSSQKALESSCFLGNQTMHNRNSKSFSSSMTEGLGFESSDDIEESIRNDWEEELERCRRSVKESSSQTEELACESRKFSRKIKIGGGNEFPPPISSIGRNRKPWMCFRSYRRDGRFILKEVRAPIQEFLHAYREDGRLKLQFIQSDDEIVDDEDEGIEERSDDCSEEEEEDCDCDKKEEEEDDDNGGIGEEC